MFMFMFAKSRPIIWFQFPVIERWHNAQWCILRFESYPPLHIEVGSFNLRSMIRHWIAISVHDRTALFPYLYLDDELPSVP